MKQLESLFILSNNSAISDFLALAKLKKTKEVTLCFSGKKASNFIQLIDVLGEFPLLEIANLTMNFNEIPCNLGKIGHLDAKKRNIQLRPPENYTFELSIEAALAKRPIPSFQINTRNKKLVTQANIFIKKYQDANLTDLERYLRYSLEMKELGLLQSKLPFHQTEHQHKSDDLFFVAGRMTGMTKKEVAEISKTTKISIASKFNAKVTHGVLTSTTNETALQNFLKQEVIFLTEDDFKELLWRENTPYLMEAENESSAENLIKLLFSDDDDNILLALELIEGGGVSDQIISCLTAIAYFSKASTIRNKVRKCFRKYASRNLQEHLKRTWRDGFRRRLDSEFMKTVGQHAELDAVEFYLMVHRLRVVGMVDENQRERQLSQIELQFPFKTLPDSIFSFSKIKNINLRNSHETDFVSIFEKLSKLSNLETLWIYDMYLTEIPIQFFDLQQVSSIAIDGWRIADLFTGESPEGIRKMNNLKLLRLTTNSQEFSGKAMIDLANFPNLTSLSIKDIPYNKIQHLDTNMNLESLSISHSGIENVPLTISRMQRLKKLGLAGNQISSIPDEVQKLPQLEELSLINNQITTLPLVLLQDRKQVKLFLKQNKITEIPIELFHTNAEKWMISLAENPIEKIPKNVPEAMGLYHGYNRFALNLYHTPLMQQPIMEPWRNKYSWLRITG